MRKRELSALMAFARVGWRRSVADKAATIGLVLFYWLILLVFWGLWQATSLAELAQLNASPAGMFWYLVVTESIVLAVGYPYRHVETEINNGDIAAALARPIPYAHAVLAEWAGQTAYRVLLLTLAGTVAGIWITGGAPIALSRIPVLVLSIAIGCATSILCQLQIGYAAAWLGSCAPVFWIWQKLQFVLGGLMIPLSFYPPLLRRVAEATPFANILYAPGSMMIGGSSHTVAATLSMQLLWLFAIGALTWVVDRKATARFAVRGI